MNTIEIVDYGRGPQLSNSRITVQDLVPYFQQDCPDEEILRWIPTLTAAEIDAARIYYRAHQIACDDADQRVREYRQEQMQQQSERFPRGSAQQRRERMQRWLEERRQEANGEGPAG